MTSSPSSIPMSSPAISIITAVYNCAQTIGTTIDSVLAQTDKSIEYIIIDGMSDDGTQAVIEGYGDRISKVIREPDQGIYDALNKGVQAASGDIVGFVHADDALADNSIVAKIKSKFADEAELDAVYGDLLYVDSQDTDKVIRYWRAGKYDRNKFLFGWMPPHPTCYLRKEIYQELGAYKTDFGSAADYECMVRLMYKHQINVGYLPEIVSKMRVGGTSNVSMENRLKANRGDRQAWLENDLRPPFGLRFTKPISKLPQYVLRPVA